MKHRILLTVLAFAGLLPFALSAQDDSEALKKVTLHGSIQSDVLLPQEDKNIGTGSYESWALTNT